ncbi:DUF1351 domain-containing protein [Secundilactobacillus similis]|uniref:DUF1351 domain-containing protein n=1 Tax=Secundilactobacillus similis DSM 23365 = JCM 2765 TaxID=1423804 RepID=A0A0R2EYB2_9LACO|nr:DUF1351 domain-containing protein [Secundilactobacillus similis]KRN20630.1 hypothetical protein FD14_GL001417 [Secundilactobacillus similis DSM 23365 = JCM 2765]
MINPVVALQVPEYDVKLTPAQIEIEGIDGLKRAVDAYSQRYSNIVVTVDTEKDAKDTRSKLNHLSKALNDKRIAIHKEYDVPYNRFADQINELKSKIDETVQPISDALKELDEQQREERKKDVETSIAEMAPNYGVEISEVEISSKWLTKSISNKAILEGIADQMKLIKAKKDVLNANIQTVTTHAETKKLDPAGWVNMLKQGQDVATVNKLIDEHVVELDKQRKQKEAAIAEAKAHQVVKDNKIINTNTGEVESYDVNLHITGTLNQMNILKDFMVEQGIRYETI